MSSTTPCRTATKLERRWLPLRNEQDIKSRGPKLGGSRNARAANAQSQGRPQRNDSYLAIGQHNEGLPWSLMPARFPSLILLIVRAAIRAAPTPLPSSAATTSTGSPRPRPNSSPQSKISVSACAWRCLKCGYLLKTEPSAPTCAAVQPCFLHMAAIPHAVRRAARVPIRSARRRISSSSGFGR